MSDKSATIRDLARSVGVELEAYIAVHNRIFQQAATLKSLVKNLFGRGVPMSTLLAEAESLVPRISSLRTDIDRFLESSGATLESGERQYMDLLSTYATALEQTVVALVARQRLLAEGSKGGRNNPMTWDAYQTIEREYQEAIERYTQIGRDLNDASPLVSE